MIDLIFAIFSAIVYSYVNAHDANNIIDPVTKNNLDWYVAAVIMLAEMRVFTLFLVVP